MYQNDSSTNTDSKENISEQNIRVKEFTTVECEFKKCTMIFYGIAPENAELLSKLTPEGLEKLNELVKIIKNKKIQQGLDCQS